ncbi:MAG TPA: nickel pincer cofactor biosynthesis protein LarC [Mycobacteriales bacterium]|nr:nickel pincer cofactor biosynthesis protein LarC [Mycobacteriales bacterium]
MTGTRRLAWVDCSTGVSGDMLLGAFVDLGVQLTDVVGALGVNADLVVDATTREGMRGVSVTVRADSEQPTRTLSDLLRIVDSARLQERVARRAHAVLRRIASAEAYVHDTTIDEVHFHEIGAVDTIVDVVGVCFAIDALAIDDLVVGPIALGGGTVETSHGVLPVPGPAVLELLAASQLSAYGGPVDVELATPTGIALLAELATAVGPMPTMRATAVGIGQGSRQLPGRPNVLRVVTGDPATSGAGDDAWRVLEANVDDLDPRLWPEVLDRLLAAGAADAWLTPILMKKGRPAHTLSALACGGAVEAVRTAMFRESSTIGVRLSPVTKSALDREWITVEVHGAQVRVKIARLDGEIVNVAPEWADVVAAARDLDRPAKEILAAATTAAGRELG